MKQSGFSLVELLVAITIIGIIALVTPKVMIKQQEIHELTRFVQQFQADSLFAKNYAQLHNKQIYIRVFPTENEYRIYERSSDPLIVATIPPTVCIPNQVNLFAHYTGKGTISQGHTVYFALPKACTRQAKTTQSLVMTIGFSVYYHVKSS
ncbi:MAG: type II secretion system protein [Culicoidibacterales bacterium]